MKTKVRNYKNYGPCHAAPAGTLFPSLLRLRAVTHVRLGYTQSGRPPRGCPFVRIVLRNVLPRRVGTQPCSLSRAQEKFFRQEHRTNTIPWWKPFLSEALREPLGTLLMVGGSGAPCKAHDEDCLSAKSATMAERARVPEASGRRP